MIKLGTTIRKFRQEAGLTQKSLADRLRIESTYLSAVETGRKEPSLALIKRIAKAVNTVPEVLLWDSVEIDKHVKNEDRKIIEMAKLLIRHYNAR